MQPLPLFCTTICEKQQSGGFLNSSKPGIAGTGKTAIFRKRHFMAVLKNSCENFVSATELADSLL